MKNTIENIIKGLREGVYKNEEHIRFSLVGRILLELGWNIWDPKEVYTEFTAVKSEDNTKVDVALFLKQGFPEIFIEVKAHNRIKENLEKVETQLRDYNRNNNAIFTVLTDGQEWRFYYSPGQGEFRDKCYSIINLFEDNIDDVENLFIKLLSKEKINNGEAKVIAEKYLESSVKERVISSSLSEIGKLIDENPLITKVQATIEILSQKGHSISKEEVLKFYKSGGLQRDEFQAKNEVKSVSFKLDSPQRHSELKLPIVNANERLMITSPKNGILAYGRSLNDKKKIIVEKGSRISINVAPKFAENGKSECALREKLIMDGVINAERYFTIDYTFNSKSQAAGVIMGGSVNGLEAWKPC